MFINSVNCFIWWICEFFYCEKSAREGYGMSATVQGRLWEVLMTWQCWEGYGKSLWRGRRCFWEVRREGYGKSFSTGDALSYVHLKVVTQKTRIQDFWPQALLTSLPLSQLADYKLFSYFSYKSTTHIIYG